MPRRSSSRFSSKFKSSQKSQPKSQPKTKSSPSSPSPRTGGFFSNVASTTLGIGAGMLLGNVLINTTKNTAQMEPNSSIQDGSADNVQEATPPCLKEAEIFGQCLNSNSTNIGNCQWAYDALKQCSEQRKF